MTNAELVEVIDALGLALADKGHKWSPELRKGYEAAIKFLTTAEKVRSGPVFSIPENHWGAFE